MTPDGLPRRRIVTEEYAAEIDRIITYEHPFPFRGDIHESGTPEDRGAEVEAAHERVMALVWALESEIGWKRADAIATAVNALEDAVRNKAIARMVHAATEMLDYAIGVIVPPEAGAEKGAVP